MRMTRLEHDELLSATAAKLKEAAWLLKGAEEELLSVQTNDLADVVDVLIATDDAA